MSLDNRDIEKIEDILDMVITYGLPLMEAGASKTGNPYDDLAVAFFKGGLPAVKDKLSTFRQPQEGGQSEPAGKASG